MQEALSFNANITNRTCDDYSYADLRLRYFQEIVLNMTKAIPLDDLKSQIQLLQEVKVMMEQLQETIPTYTGYFCLFCFYNKVSFVL